MACCRPRNHPYYTNHAICRVKFGVPLDQVCKNSMQDIPGPLLVTINFILYYFYHAIAN